MITLRKYFQLKYLLRLRLSPIKCFYLPHFLYKLKINKSVFRGHWGNLKEANGSKTVKFGPEKIIFKYPFFTLTSVSQRSIPSAVVKHYCARYTFLRNRRYSSMGDICICKLFFLDIIAQSFTNSTLSNKYKTTSVRNCLGLRGGTMDGCLVFT